MTTATSAYNAIRARLEATGSGIIIPMYWQNEPAPALPDTPSPFAYVEFTAEPGRLAEFGGGRGQNRYRNPARVDAYVFVPRYEGLAVATDHAETIAARLRSYRDSDISCFDATVYPGGNGSDVKPPGVQSEVDNYFWAVAEISLHYDLIG